jgi:hypothetical protein
MTPIAEEMDRGLAGAAAVYERAMRWGHLPAAMTFERYLAAIRRGDDPFVVGGRRADFQTSTNPTNSWQSDNF